MNFSLSNVSQPKKIAAGAGALALVLIAIVAFSSKSAIYKGSLVAEQKIFSLPAPTAIKPLEAEKIKPQPVVPVIAIKDFVKEPEKTEPSKEPAKEVAEKTPEAPPIISVPVKLAAAPEATEPVPAAPVEPAEPTPALPETVEPTLAEPAPALPEAVEPTPAEPAPIEPPVAEPEPAPPEQPPPPLPEEEFMSDEELLALLGSLDDEITQITEPAEEAAGSPPADSAPISVAAAPFEDDRQAAASIENNPAVSVTALSERATPATEQKSARVRRSAPERSSAPEASSRIQNDLTAAAIAADYAPAPRSAGYGTVIRGTSGPGSLAAYPVLALIANGVWALYRRKKI